MIAVHKKFDKDKRRWRLLPYEVLEQVVAILILGLISTGLIIGKTVTIGTGTLTQ